MYPIYLVWGPGAIFLPFLTERWHPLAIGIIEDEKRGFLGNICLATILLKLSSHRNFGCFSSWFQQSTRGRLFKVLWHQTLLYMDMPVHAPATWQTRSMPRSHAWSHVRSNLIPCRHKDERRCYKCSKGCKPCSKHMIKHLPTLWSPRSAALL